MGQDEEIIPGKFCDECLVSGWHSLIWVLSGMQYHVSTQRIKLTIIDCLIKFFFIHRNRMNQGGMGMVNPLALMMQQNMGLLG